MICKVFSNLFLIASIGVLCSSCCGNAERGSIATAAHNPALATAPVLPSIPFLSAKPGNRDSLEASLNGDYARIAIAQVMSVLKTYEDLNFEIVGFTDDKECEYTGCELLSIRRADMVREWLIDSGISSSRLLPAAGKGSTRPLGMGNSEESRSVNRRVEVHFVP